MSRKRRRIEISSKINGLHHIPMFYMEFYMIHNHSDPLWSTLSLSPNCPRAEPHIPLPHTTDLHPGNPTIFSNNPGISFRSGRQGSFAGSRDTSLDCEWLTQRVSLHRCPVPNRVATITACPRIFTPGRCQQDAMRARNTRWPSLVSVEATARLVARDA